MTRDEMLTEANYCDTEAAFWRTQIEVYQADRAMLEQIEGTVDEYERAATKWRGRAALTPDALLAALIARA